MINDFDPYAEWLGIPGDRRPPNYYDLLGLDLFEGDEEVIRSRGQEQFAVVHKYQVGRHQKAAIELLRELMAAFACLSDAELKQQYDADLRAQQAATAARPTEAEAGPPDVDGQDRAWAELDVWKQLDEPVAPPHRWPG